MPNFPSNPTVGQIYAVDVRSWRWNGSAWDMLSISDTQVTRAESAANRAEAAALTIGTAAAFSDANPIVKGSADNTKQARFEVDGFSPSTTHTFTLPNRSGTVAMTDDVTDVVLLASVTPTAVSAIDLPNVFSDAYESYLIVLTDLGTVGKTQVRMRVITDGATVISGNSYYGGQAENINYNGASNTMVLNLANSGDVLRTSAVLNFHRGASALFEGSSISMLDPLGMHYSPMGYLAFASNITGFRLVADASTFNASGRIKVYGYVKT